MRLWRAGLAWRLVCCDRGRGAMHGSVDDGTKRIDNDNRSEDGWIEQGRRARGGAHRDAGGRSEGDATGVNRGGG